MVQHDTRPRAHAWGCPTGAPGLDRALGIGGYPRGRVVEVVGPASSGKTTLALCSIAAVQGAGGRAAFVDAEGALDLRWAGALGIALEQLPICRPQSGEAALDMVRILVASGGFELVVIDSVAALAPTVELTAGIGASDPGLRARMWSRGLCELAPSLARSGAVLLLLDQARGARSGGRPIRGKLAVALRATVRLAVRGVRPAGHRGVAIRLSIAKNTVSAERTPSALEPLWSGSAEPPGAG